MAVDTEQLTLALADGFDVGQFVVKLSGSLRMGVSVKTEQFVQPLALGKTLEFIGPNGERLVLKVGASTKSHTDSATGDPKVQRTWILSAAELVIGDHHVPEWDADLPQAQA